MKKIVKLVAIIGVALTFACGVIVGNNFKAEAIETKNLSKESIGEYYVNEHIDNGSDHDYEFVVESKSVDENGNEWIKGYVYEDGELDGFSSFNATWYYSQMNNARNS